jgi:hypothetical protein
MRREINKGKSPPCPLKLLARSPKGAVIPETAASVSSKDDIWAAAPIGLSLLYVAGADERCFDRSGGPRTDDASKLSPCRFQHDREPWHPALAQLKDMRPERRLRSEKPWYLGQSVGFDSSSTLEISMLYRRPLVFTGVALAATPLMMHPHAARDCNPRIELCALSDAR